MGLDNDDIKALIAILQKGLENNDVQDNIKPNKKPTKLSAKNNKSKSKPQRENKFLSMKEKNMHKADVAIDKKLNRFPPSERSRPFDPVIVKCRVCGKEEAVNPASIDYKNKERYKCNRCSTSAG